MAAKPPVEQEMEQAVAAKMSGEGESGYESPIEVEIKVCADSWEQLRQRLPALFK